jgi:hypothetical protein
MLDFTFKNSRIIVINPDDEIGAAALVYRLFIRLVSHFSNPLQVAYYL